MFSYLYWKGDEDRGLIFGVDSLLNDPNTSSPANVEASNLYKENRKEYSKRVKETVEKSWED
jgi:ubiquitin-conjugating enzyme E2 A